MGFFSSFCSGISSFAGSVGECISSCCSAINSAIASVSSTLASIAKPFLDVVAGLSEAVIKAVGGIIHAIAVALGIVQPEVEPEEVGARALEHPEIKPEEYDTYKDYIDALMKKNFDKGKWDKEASLGEKSAASVLGSSIEAKAIEGKNDMNIPIEVYLTAHNKGLSPTDLQGVFSNLKANGIQDASLITKYFKGELQGGLNEKIGAIIDEIKSLDSSVQ